MRRAQRPGRAGYRSIHKCRGNFEAGTPARPGNSDAVKPPWHPIILEWSIPVDPWRPVASKPDINKVWWDYEPNFIADTFTLSENKPDFDFPDNLSLLDPNNTKAVA